MGLFNPDRSGTINTNKTSTFLKQNAAGITQNRPAENNIRWNSERLIDSTKGIAKGLFNSSSPTGSSQTANDNRVRLTLKSTEAWNRLFGLSADSGFDPMEPSYRKTTTDITSQSDILAPLHPEFGLTNGLVFPYTPSINYSYLADWQATPLVHTNYQAETYNRSYIDAITITGQFTAQDVDEAKYSLAAIHFFRTITKMAYGEKDGDFAGTPPPTLLLSGHGEMMFNKIPVVVKSFIHDLLPDADYVDVHTQNGMARVPTIFSISVTLGVQYDLIKVRKEFSLSEFASGKLTGKGGYI